MFRQRVLIAVNNNVHFIYVLFNLRDCEPTSLRFLIGFSRLNGFLLCCHLVCFILVCPELRQCIPSLQLLRFDAGIIAADFGFEFIAGSLCFFEVILCRVESELRWFLTVTQERDNIARLNHFLCHFLFKCLLLLFTDFQLLLLAFCHLPWVLFYACLQNR